MESHTRVTGSFDQSLAVVLRAIRALHHGQLVRDWLIGFACILLSVVAAAKVSPWLAGALVIVGVLLCFGWLDPQQMQARLLFRRNPELRHRVEIVADETGVTFNAPGSSTHMQWSRYQRIVERPNDVIVMVFGKDMFHAIPTEAFATAADVKTFRRLGSEALFGVRSAESPRTSR